MKKTLFSTIKFFFGWPLSILAIVYLVYSVLSNLPTILEKVTGVHPLLLTFGVLSFLVYFFIRAYSWQEILQAFGYTLPFVKTNYLWGKSEARRYIPGNVWSFLSRAFLFSQEHVDKKHTAKGLIVEAQLIIIGSFIVSVLSVPFLFREVLKWSEFSALGMKAVMVLLAVGTGVYIFQQPLLSYFGLSKQKIVSYVFPGFSPRVMAKLVGLSSLSFFFFGLGYYLVAGSVVPLHPQNILELTGFFTLSYILGYLSLITPSGLGVREGLITYGLSPILSLELASFIALVTRFVLTVTEGVYLFLSYILSFRNNTYVKRIISLFDNKLPEVILGCGIVMFSIYFSLTSMARYDSFYTGRFDLGNMAQTVWNTKHGNIFELTDPNGVENASRLGTHADFILIAFAPLYFLWEDPRVLLILQAVVIALGAIFVYKIALQVLKSKSFALAFGLLYLLNPSVQRSVLYDFHSVVLATTFLLGAFYFLSNKRYLWFALFAILAGITKEQVWIIIALLGAYIAVIHKKWLYGGAIIVTCVGLSYYLISSAIPHHSTGTHFALQYYSEYGESTTDVVKNIFLSPIKTLETVLLPDRIEYLKQIFLPFSYYSFFNPLALIFMGPEIAIYLLSNNPQLHQIYYQYTATLTPFIIIAAIYSISYLRKVVPLVPRWVHLAILSGVGLYAVYLYGPLPGSKSPNLDMFLRPIPNKDQITGIIHSIPEELSIAATNNAGSHLSHRREIFTLPNGIGRAEGIVILADAKSSELSSELKDLVARISTDSAYLKQFDNNQLVVFRKVSSK